jgi:hypothetical protein
MQLLLPWLLDFRIHGLLVLSVNLNLKQQMIGWAPKLRMFQPMWRQQSSVALLKLEAGRLSFACLDGPNRLQGNSFQEAKWCTAHRCAQYEIWCCNMLLYIYIFIFIYTYYVLLVKNGLLSTSRGFSTPNTRWTSDMIYVHVFPYIAYIYVEILKPEVTLTVTITQF